MTLAVLLPTRGRPDNFRRFMEAFVTTAVDSHVLVRLDTDDPSVTGYDEHLETYRQHITVTHGERVGFGPSLNELAFHAEWMGFHHLGMFGDDVVPKTPGWDIALVEALGDDLGVAYGDDGLRKMHAPDLPTHYVTQTEVYRRLGYLAPPNMRHLFLDNVARDIGRHLGNFVFVPVRINHLHPWWVGEKVHDQTYAEGGRNAEIRKSDRATYLSWSARRDWKKRLRG